MIFTTISFTFFFFNLGTLCSAHWGDSSRCSKYCAHCQYSRTVHVTGEWLPCLPLSEYAASIEIHEKYNRRDMEPDHSQGWTMAHSSHIPEASYSLDISALDWRNTSITVIYCYDLYQNITILFLPPPSLNVALWIIRTGWINKWMDECCNKLFFFF